MQCQICEITSGKGNVCCDILRDLPEWFGIPEVVDAYVNEAEKLPMFGAILEGSIVAFLSVKRHTLFAAEAYVLGVKRKWHRKGIGRRMFEHVEHQLREQGIVFLTVKTVAPDRLNEAYVATRRFYEGLGFLPVEVFPTLWGPESPCLFMIKNIGPECLALTS